LDTAFVKLTNLLPYAHAVTGTPGIGKSCFLYYLLARLLALEEPPPYIIWEHWSSKNKRVRLPYLMLRFGSTVGVYLLRRMYDLQCVF
jgi:hypothetical protein